jgi:tetratricopeptide (TPR) repeat protein
MKNKKKSMLKTRRPFFVFCLILFSLLMAWNISAASMVFRSEQVCKAARTDTEASCRAMALENAKNEIYYLLTTYLESLPKIKEYQLTPKELRMISIGMFQTDVVESLWENRVLSMKVKAVVDSHDVVRTVDFMRRRPEEIQQVREITQETAEIFKRAGELRRELSSMEKAKNSLQLGQFEDTMKKLMAADLLERGYSFQTLGGYDSRLRSYHLYKAIDSYTKALELDPKQGRIHFYRGEVYRELGDVHNATDDFKASARLNFIPAQNYLRSKKIQW